MQKHQLLTNQIILNFPEYLEILSQTEDRYIVCLPPDNIIEDQCEIDPKFIQEHILEVLGSSSSFQGNDVPDYRSLTGLCYKSVEHELHLIPSNSSSFISNGQSQGQPPLVYSTILSSDLFHTTTGQVLKRFMLSNTLDQRFYKEIENKYLQGQVGPSGAQAKTAGQGQLRVMRDPYQFIQFFKQNVYHEVEETYHDFLEDIKILRENHIMIKGHERASGRNFIKIGQKFKQHLEQLQIIHLAFQQYPDQIKKETIENLAETLIYERIGTYLRRQLVNLYQYEETKLAHKCRELCIMFNDQIMVFNRIFGCNLLPNMKPNKSLKIFKLFLTKSQLPYEMVFVLCKCQKVAIQELAEFYNRDQSQIDAETMMPYILYIVVRGIMEVSFEHFNKKRNDMLQQAAEGAEDMATAEEMYASEPYQQDHLMDSAFISRMLMIEFFTVKEQSFDESQYAFVTFKNVEEMIDKYAK